MTIRFYILFFLLCELPVTAAFALGVYYFHVWVLSFCCTL